MKITVKEWVDELIDELSAPTSYLFQNIIKNDSLNIFSNFFVQSMGAENIKTLSCSKRSSYVVTALLTWTCYSVQTTIIDMMQPHIDIICRDSNGHQILACAMSPYIKGSSRKPTARKKYKLNLNLYLEDNKRGGIYFFSPRQSVFGLLLLQRKILA